MVNNLPPIISARVSFIIPTVLPDLLLNYEELKPEFSFLSSAKSYAEYYRHHESPAAGGTAACAHIPALDTPLVPLKRTHAMHSYWKAFRRSVELAKADGKTLTELFTLLPLKITIPLNPLGVQGKHYSAKAYAYLFPFGGCVTNVDVTVLDMPFDDFIRLIPNLRRASISAKIRESDQAQDMGSFNHFAQEISRMINTELFGDAGEIEPFPAHTFVFIEKTGSELYEWVDDHKNAIAAILSGKNIEDAAKMSPLKRAELLRNKIEILQRLELLYFTPACSLFYATPEWDVQISPDLGEMVHAKKQKKLYRKMGCMRHNYQSCLNLLFAVNRVLGNAVVEDRQIPSVKRDELRTCLGRAFPDDETKFYFKFFFKTVAPLISLDKRLTGLRSP